ncbi:DUF2254 domain-containing protein [Actinotalea sp. M2MS4P-6]|uniref:DUF2254 domain-containing protein n=1 Tax=Actinotalea sp. M2MS4P-6 TaxID=2983762 RepID=UPI0021E3A320|nr:DUF2254 domain-containing protein [Actinotalea sp. M2MS4P-6]MCV2394828.1 DUF2254 domain-containing protein [Actinotalea sp. M2MS4P-6]
MTALGAAAWRLRGWARRWFRSLLGVPVLAVLGGALLAVATLGLSLAIEAPTLATVDVAQQVLLAIGGATLTLAGFVLTIATLSLQFGATTYAPRLVEQLRRDRLLRFTLGGALGTFTYSIVVVLTVRSQHQDAATVATVLALVGATGTVLLFIALLDRLTARLRPGRTMAQLTEDARQAIARTYPDPASGAPEHGRDGVPGAASAGWAELPADAVVRREEGFGSLVDVDAAALATLARERAIQVDLLVPIGSFLGPDEPVALVTRAGSDAPADVDEEITAQVLGALALGDERTVDADPSYPLRLLVDIAIRALSPGLNDPTTAGQAIDHIGEVLVEASRRRLGPRALADDGRSLVVVPAPGWAALLDLAWTEIWHFGSDPQTRAALRTAFRRLQARVEPARRHELDELTSRLESAS